MQAASSLWSAVPRKQRSMHSLGVLPPGSYVPCTTLECWPQEVTLHAQPWSAAFRKLRSMHSRPHARTHPLGVSQYTIELCMIRDQHWQLGIRGNRGHG
eukprot:365067-Chlamydomonas_euryale.AAC.17